MTTRPTVRRVAVAGLVMLLCGVAPAFAQDEDFKAGIDARGRNRWDDVIASMQRAAAREPDSGRSVRTSVFQLTGTPYLPLFYLGEAHFKKEDCVNALAAWAQSLQRKAIEKEAQSLRTLKDGQAVCVQRGVLLPDEYPARLAAAQKKLTDTTAAADRVNALATEFWPDHADWQQSYQTARGELQTASARIESAMRTHLRAELTESGAASDSALGRLNALDKLVRAELETVQTITAQAREVEQFIASIEGVDQRVSAAGAKLAPNVTKSRESARDLIREAKEKLNTGRRARNVATITEARSSAQQAEKLFVEVEKAASDLIRKDQEARFQSASSVAGDILLSVETLLSRLDTRAAQQPREVTPEAAAEREKVRASLVRVRRRLDDARGRQDTAGVQQAVTAANQARQEIETMLTAFGPLTLEDRGVAAPLQNAVRSYLNGEYQQAIAVLDSASIETFGAMAIHAHVVRAAALYTLYLRSGEQDPSLLRRATTAATTARSMQPGFAPDPRVFSTRFLEFYRQPR
jgi:hypothetical protein